MNRLKVLVFAALAGCSLQAMAQGYPTKPVQVILAFTPGSAVDIVGRIVTAKVSEMWGQPIINDNRSGAGGSIGSAAVARAAPDGYTLLVTSNAHTVNPAIIANLPYETLKDFTDIVPMAEQPNVMVVAADAPYKTLRDLVAAAKAKPDAINLGHAGIGSGTHLSTLKFVAAANVKVVQVPFKGTPEVITAILGHNVDGYWAPISAVLSNVKSGKLRPLAVKERRIRALGRHVGTGWHESRAGEQDQRRRTQGARRSRREGEAAEPRQRHPRHVAAGVLEAGALRAAGIFPRTTSRRRQAAVSSRFSGTLVSRCSSSKERPSTVSTT
ncbi:MAG: tripartite tricarboxylate transporter substrate binding protein [Betaproteobacteria bacterium]|nr:tripartite tricarboxylate transporter substrate binding protein [Betaproteobacteria bacterium]